MYIQNCLSTWERLGVDKNCCLRESPFGVPILLLYSRPPPPPPPPHTHPCCSLLVSSRSILIKRRPHPLQLVRPKTVFCLTYHISPLLETSGTELDMNEPNWLPSWSQEEFKQLQREDSSLKLVHDSK